MLNDRKPRVMVFGSKWLGAEVISCLKALGAEVACVAPSNTDRAFLAANGAAVAKADSIELTPADFPWRPDLCLSAGSFRIIPAWVIDWSRLGAIGYHPSMLPAFKGRNAIRDAINSGVRMTGGTVYWLTSSVDGGPPVIANGRRLQGTVQIIPDEAPLALWQRALAPLGRDLLVESVKAVLTWP